MTQLSAYGLAFAACLATMAMLANDNVKVTTIPDVEARVAADGAFRDGLYLGKLTAEGGQPPRPAIGRWTTDQDRSMFAAGYKPGYAESLAEVRAKTAPPSLQNKDHGLR